MNNTVHELLTPANARDRVRELVAGGVRVDDVDAGRGDVVERGGSKMDDLVREF